MRLKTGHENSISFVLDELARFVEAVIDGDSSIEITGLAKIEEAQSGQLSFIAHPKYEKYIHESAASAVLVRTDFPKVDKTVLRCDDPYFAFMMLVKRFYGMEVSLEAGVHPTAIIGEGTNLGADVAIGAHVVIGKNCTIGRDVQIHPGVIVGDNVMIDDNTILYANVCIREGCQIGKSVIIHMGAVVGSDGFGYAFKNGQYHKIPQVGIVVIEDDVEIGANTTIDRASLGATVIKRGAKLDNLIQIAHNVEIGEHSVMAAQAGISGSTKIGKYVKLGGQAGLVGHIKVGDQAAVGAQGGVTKDVPPGAFVSGYPARPHMQAKREEASLSQLPELLKRVKKIENELRKLLGES